MSRTKRRSALPQTLIEQQVRSGVSTRTIQGWVRIARHQLPQLRGTITVSVVGPRTMRQLNRIWRGRNRPTNVLSFNYPSAKGFVVADQEISGEILLCPTVIRQEAPAYDRTYRQHLRALIEHGLLHLCGLDHETPSQQRRWKLLERRLQHP